MTLTESELTAWNDERLRRVEEAIALREDVTGLHSPHEWQLRQGRYQEQADIPHDPMSWVDRWWLAVTYLSSAILAGFAVWSLAHWAGWL